MARKTVTSGKSSKATGKPAARKAAAKRPTPKKPTPKKPTTKKPANRKSASKKPATRKRAAAAERPSGPTTSKPADAAPAAPGGTDPVLPVFYRSPQPVTRERHENYMVRQDATYAFAARTNSVPLNAAEFPLAGMDYQPRLKPLGKAIRAGAAEVQENPRARSAVLRVAERLQ